jgi:hypothetical protein
MWQPRVRGEIERRLLVNYRVDPGVLARTLPAPFRPQLVDGSAVAGICLIRLGALRVAGMPQWAGLRSENAAHRIAVEWDDRDGATRSGVYIPRRDSDSWANIALGGRLYPGEHHRARFQVSETEESIGVTFTAVDGSADVDVAVRLTEQFVRSALFATLADASAFFEAGSVGYSATRLDSQFDGLQLQTSAWKVEPAVVMHARSSFFEDRFAFPRGTAELDSALVMRDVPVDWLPLSRLDATADTVLM